MFGAIPRSILVITFVLAALATLAIFSAGCGGDDGDPAGPSDPTGADLYVDAINGNDVTGSGSEAGPWKTITKALSMARQNDVVFVAPGTYDTANGETLPITIPNGVTLQGADWNRCIIRVNAEARGVRHAVDLSCDDCVIRGFTLEEEKIVDPFVTTFVRLTGCTNALVDSLRCIQRTITGALRIDTDTGSTVQNCYFNDSPAGYHERGVSVFGNGLESTTTLRNLTVTGYLRALVFLNPQNTLVESCTLSGNQVAVELCCYGEASTQPNPDFGGGARAGVGQNDFSGNASYGILNGTRHSIYARYCTWEHNPPTDGVDYWNSDNAGGEVIWDW
jgi:hypothetical protein